MRKLKHVYAGTPHNRVIRKSDFTSLGVEDQDKIDANPKNGHVVELSDAAATKLLEVEPGDWEDVTDDSSTSDGESANASGGGTDDDGTADDSPASRTTRRRPPSS